MPHAEPDRARDSLNELSLLRCKELARYAIDRLGMEGANRLSPRDRARLASATAVLKEICEGPE